MRNTPDFGNWPELTTKKEPEAEQSMYAGI